jgi:hypothetical protein
MSPESKKTSQIEDVCGAIIFIRRSANSQGAGNVSLKDIA